jgi:hypothetical protein
MAQLIKPVEELLALITDENERKSMREGFEKWDFLQKAVEGNLRQQDYDKKMNEAKVEVEKYQQQAKKWDEWATENVPKHDKLLKMYNDLETKSKTLEEEKALAVAAAAKAAGEGGTPVDTAALLKQVDDIIAKRGYVSTADVQKIADAEATKLVDAKLKTVQDAFFKQTVPGVMAEILNMNKLQFNHMKEFNGDTFDTEKFDAFRAEKKIMDLNEAYDRFVSEARTKASTDKLTKEITEKVEKEYATKHNLPGSGVPAAPELGPLQINRLGKAPTLPADTELGDNRAAYAAASELRNEGKW